MRLLCEEKKVREEEEVHKEHNVGAWFCTLKQAQRDDIIDRKQNWTAGAKE